MGVPLVLSLVVCKVLSEGEGVPLDRTGGTPKQYRKVPQTGQGYLPQAGYVSGGMPLAVMQKDFLVI